MTFPPNIYPTSNTLPHTKTRQGFLEFPAVSGNRRHSFTGLLPLNDPQASSPEPSFLKLFPKLHNRHQSLCIQGLLELGVCRLALVFLSAFCPAITPITLSLRGCEETTPLPSTSHGASTTAPEAARHVLTISVLRRENAGTQRWSHFPRVHIWERWSLHEEADLLCGESPPRARHRSEFSTSWQHSPHTFQSETAKLKWRRQPHKASPIVLGHRDVKFSLTCGIFNRQYIYCSRNGAYV